MYKAVGENDVEIAPLCAPFVIQKLFPSTLSSLDTHPDDLKPLSLNKLQLLPMRWCHLR